MKKELIELIGIGFALASLIMYLRIFIIISLGYTYIAYEPNSLILFIEICIAIFSIIIVCLITKDLLFKIRGDL